FTNSVSAALDAAIANPNNAAYAAALQQFKTNLIAQQGTDPDATQAALTNCPNDMTTLGNLLDALVNDKDSLLELLNEVETLLDSLTSPDGLINNAQMIA